MEQLKVFDRQKKEIFLEKVYGQKILSWLYKPGCFSWFFRFLFSYFPWASKLYGFWHRTAFSKKKIPFFVRKFHLKTTEFVKEIKEFSSFNDFFIRKLKPEARPLSFQKAVLPADARYLVFPALDDIKSFFVKEKAFDLKTFLQDAALAQKYASGSMVIARLSPVDCHRFYFPFDCVPQESKLINGCLYSVNPLALQKSLKNFLENKRVLTLLKTKQFKDVLFVEIGATNVGSIVQTYQAGKSYLKGEEKGYFALGGSSLVLLFEKDTIKFDQDLVDQSLRGLETYALMGSSLGD